MNILILGAGGREHAMAWKISQSDLCEDLYVAPGNAGTSNIAENIDLSTTDFEGISNFIRKNDIGLLMVGPEVPLCAGIRDYMETAAGLENLLIVGPGKAGAELEGSKDFSKDFMERHAIPTARYKTFTAADLDAGLAFISEMSTPVVLKADGLAAGKGVIIAQTHEEAKQTLQEMLVDHKFGAASDKVVIEEFLDGIELSVFVLTDGKNYVCLPEAKDYKRIGDADSGPNTGGMGAVSPVPFATADFLKKVDQKVIIPTIEGLQNDGIPYCGFIFIGLMNINGEPYVIEYNVRMGDPETQVVLPRIKGDFLKLLIAAAEGKLKNYPIKFEPQTATTLVLVAGGYPGDYEKGKVISGLDTVTEAMVFHAGTKLNKANIVSNGGRVLSLTGMGSTIEEAVGNSYAAASKIDWENVYFRKDIGQDLLKHS